MAKNKAKSRTRRNNNSSTKVNARIQRGKTSLSVGLNKPTFNSDPFPNKMEKGARGLVRDFARNARKKQQMKGQIAAITKAPAIIQSTGHAIAEASAPYVTSRAYQEKIKSSTPSSVNLYTGSLGNDEDNALPKTEEETRPVSRW